ncbi:MAG TPA: Rieske 2Fe-2S domain-containing protein [Fredinandcohnia sp.]|nr:Rieske 2Fe-2S domain-containing protein [Fredinandcohnia sp.]
MQRIPVEAPEEGKSVKFRVVVGGEEVEAFAVRFGGVVRAYVNRCTHRDLPLDLGEGGFFSESGRTLLCRAHGARFDPSNGACVGGLCPEGSALRALRVEEREGALYFLDDER